jgi:hypothetical protein
MWSFCYVYLVNVRHAFFAALALAILLPRIAGLHFHVEEPHHEAHSQSVHVAGIPVDDSLGGMEDDHLLEHQAGAVDIDSVAMSATTAKALPPLLLVALIGVAAFLLPSLRIFLPIRPPLRPPRRRLRFEILPPSQGPPRAA